MLSKLGRLNGTSAAARRPARARLVRGAAQVQLKQAVTPLAHSSCRYADERTASQPKRNGCCWFQTYTRTRLVSQSCWQPHMSISRSWCDAFSSRSTPVSSRPLWRFRGTATLSSSSAGNPCEHISHTQRARVR